MDTEVVVHNHAIETIVPGRSLTAERDGDARAKTVGGERGTTQRDGSRASPGVWGQVTGEELRRRAGEERSARAEVGVTERERDIVTSSFCRRVDMGGCHDLGVGSVGGASSSVPSSRARSPCSTTPSTASSPTPRRARDGSCCSSPSSTASPKGCCSAARYAAVPARVAVPVTTAVYTTTSMASGNLMFGLSALLLGTLVGMERRASGGVLAPSCRTSPGRSRCCSCCETSSADRVDPPAGDTQIRHQVEVPGPLLNGPVTLAVIQPP